jgi:hypothetical protein
MSEMVVNNPNIVIDAPGQDPRAASPGSAADAPLLRRLRQARREIEALACSAVWAEDCLYRGADYLPDFQCDCPACRARFPDRRYPRAVRESRYSIDCQVETDEDPEFAEDLALLRNDRARVGSVFIGHPTRTVHIGRRRRATDPSS